MRRLRWVAGFFFVLWLAGTGAAFAQGADGDGAANAPQIALLLAPLLAAATAIERIIEMIFDRAQNLGGVLARLLGIGGEYLKLVREQVEGARQAVNTLLEESRKPDEAGSVTVQLRQAESALTDAEDRLVDYFKSPGYVAKKRALSLLLGIGGGLAVALSMRLGIFQLLSIPGFGLQEVEGTGAQAAELTSGWRNWLDYALTGLIIGTGSGPVHSLIGLLQNTSDAVGKARALMSGKAVSEIEGVLGRLQEQAAQGARPARSEGVDGDRGDMDAPAATAAAPVPSALSQVQIRRTSRRLLGDA